MVGPPPRQPKLASLQRRGACLDLSWRGPSWQQGWRDLQSLLSPVSLPRHSLNGILKPFSQASCCSKETSFTWPQILQGWARPPPTSSSAVLFTLHPAHWPLPLSLSPHGSASVLLCGCHTLPSPSSENPFKASLPLSLARLDAVVGNYFPLGTGPLTVSPEINLAGLHACLFQVRSHAFPFEEIWISLARGYFSIAALGMNDGAKSCFEFLLHSTSLPVPAHPGRRQ